jgi:hypothetical protein
VENTKGRHLVVLVCSANVKPAYAVQCGINACVTTTGATGLPMLPSTSRMDYDAAALASRGFAIPFSFATVIALLAESHFAWALPTFSFAILTARMACSHSRFAICSATINSERSALFCMDSRRGRYCDRAEMISLSRLTHSLRRRNRIAHCCKLSP